MKKIIKNYLAIGIILILNISVSANNVNHFEKVWKKKIKGLEKRNKTQKEDKILKIKYDKEKIKELIEDKRKGKLKKEGIAKKLSFPKFLVTAHPSKIIYYDESGNVKNKIIDIDSYTIDGEYVSKRAVNISKNKKNISQIVLLNKAGKILWETREEEQTEDEGYGFDKSWVFSDGKALAVWMSYAHARFGKLRFYDKSGKLVNETKNYGWYSKDNISSSKDYLIISLSEYQEPYSTEKFKDLSGAELVEAINKLPAPSQYLFCFDKAGNIIWKIPDNNYSGVEINDDNEFVRLIHPKQKQYLIINLKNGKELQKYSYSDGYLYVEGENTWKIKKDETLEIYKTVSGKILNSFSLSPIRKNMKIDKEYKRRSRRLIGKNYFVITYYDPNMQKDMLLMLIDLEKKKLISRKTLNDTKKASIQKINELPIIGIVDYGQQDITLINIIDK